MPSMEGFRRTTNGVQVDLQERPWQGTTVLVEERQGRWTIRQIRFWIN